MTVVTLDDTPSRPRDTAGPQSRHLHADAVHIAHAATTLLVQGLRMLFVVSCFAAVVAAVIAVRLYAFLPALHH